MVDVLEVMKPNILSVFSVSVLARFVSEKGILPSLVSLGSIGVSEVELVSSGFS